MGKNNQPDVSHLAYFADAVGLAYDSDTAYRHDILAMQVICERTQHDLLDRRHKDPSALAKAFAGAWSDVASEDSTGFRGLKHQGQYFSGIASAMGMSLDTDKIRRMCPLDKRSLAHAISGSMSVSDPELASGYIKDLADGVKRDSYGRELGDNGRPVQFSRTPPGSYLHELSRDNARIEAKRASARYPDAGREPERETEPKPARKGMFARMMDAMRLRDDDDGFAECGHDGPEA